MTFANPRSFLQGVVAASPIILRLTLQVMCALALLSTAGVIADDQLRLRDICRLKGQEENTLQGLGLVVGLKGTGDEKVKPTARWRE